MGGLGGHIRDPAGIGHLGKSGSVNLDKEKDAFCINFITVKILLFVQRGIKMHLKMVTSTSLLL